MSSELSFHTLRQTFFRLANAGVAPELRLKLIGHSRVQRLSIKLATKLVTDGPLTVRDLTRKCSKLKTIDCRRALDWLADRQIATQKDNVWGIRGDIPSFHALMALNADGAR